MKTKGEGMEPSSDVSRFLRLKQIIGDKRADPPIVPLVPVSASSLWAWVAEGRFPEPVRIGPNTTVWTWESIQDFLNRSFEDTES